MTVDPARKAEVKNQLLIREQLTREYDRLRRVLTDERWTCDFERISDKLVDQSDAVERVARDVGYASAAIASEDIPLDEEEITSTVLYRGAGDRAMGMLKDDHDFGITYAMLCEEATKHRERDLVRENIEREVRRGVAHANASAALFSVISGMIGVVGGISAALAITRPAVEGLREDVRRLERSPVSRDRLPTDTVVDSKYDGRMRTLEEWKLPDGIVIDPEYTARIRTLEARQEVPRGVVVDTNYAERMATLERRAQPEGVVVDLRYNERMTALETGRIPAERLPEGTVIDPNYKPAEASPATAPAAPGDADLKGRIEALERTIHARFGR